jgi:hypothetical protein
MIKDKLKMAWDGVEMLLEKAERPLAGIPFQTPFAAVNVFIELGNVCPSLILYSTFANNCRRPLSTTRMCWKNS